MQQEAIDDLGMDKSVLLTLAANIEALRHRGGEYLSQREVARQAGLDQTTLGRMITMSNWPTLEKIARVAQAFNCQPWQLIAPDMGMKISVDEAKLSPSAVHLARKFDAIKDESERARAYAFLSQTLEFANFTAWPVGPKMTPNAAKPKRTRARRKSREEAPSPQSAEPTIKPARDHKG